MARTYYERITARATTAHVATFESALIRDVPGAGEQQSVTVGATAVTAWCWTSDTTEPGLASWPTNEYGAQFDVAAIGVDIVFGALNLGTAFGHFGRVDAALLVDVETHAQVEAAFAGAGLHRATYNGAWGGVLSTDRLEVLVAVQRPTGMGNQTLTLRFDGDGVVDGQWAAGSAPPPSGTASDTVAITTASAEAVEVTRTPADIVEVQTTTATDTVEIL